MNWASLRRAYVRKLEESASYWAEPDPEGAYSEGRKEADSRDVDREPKSRERKERMKSRMEPRLRS